MDSILEELEKIRNIKQILIGQTPADLDNTDLTEIRNTLEEKLRQSDLEKVKIGEIHSMAKALSDKISKGQTTSQEDVLQYAQEAMNLVNQILSLGDNSKSARKFNQILTRSKQSDGESPAQMLERIKSYHSKNRIERFIEDSPPFEWPPSNTQDLQ